MLASEPVLVTGAAGYIGQHLVKRLGREGLAVSGFSRRPRPAINGLAAWHQGDVTRLDDLRRAMAGCRQVIHLACLPLGPSRQDPLAAFQINTVGTLNVLQAALEMDALPVIYSSTAQVYGRPSRLPMGEQDQVRPDSPYAAGKLCGETICQSYAQDFDLPVTILRLFNVYGLAADGSDRPTVESIFLRRILKGQPPVLPGDPNEGRDFLHVSDVIEAILAAIQRKPAGEVINVGTGVMTPLLDLAWKLIKITGAELEPVVQSERKDLLQMQAELTKAGRLLGFSPQVSLEEGLAQMVKQGNLRQAS